jgi:hypothetical protein
VSGRSDVEAMEGPWASAKDQYYVDTDGEA